MQNCAASIGNALEIKYQVQNCGISIANTLQISQSCTKPLPFTTHKICKQWLMSYSMFRCISHLTIGQCQSTRWWAVPYMVSRSSCHHKTGPCSSRCRLIYTPSTCIYCVVVIEITRQQHATTACIGPGKVSLTIFFSTSTLCIACD